MVEAVAPRQVDREKMNYLKALSPELRSAEDDQQLERLPHLEEFLEEKGSELGAEEIRQQKGRFYDEDCIVGVAASGSRH